MTLNFNSNPHQINKNKLSLYEENRYMLSLLPKLFVVTIVMMIFFTSIIFFNQLGLSGFLPLFGFAKENVNYSAEDLINKNEQINIQIFAQAISLNSSISSFSSSKSTDKFHNDSNIENILDYSENSSIISGFSGEKAVDLEIVENKTFYLDQNCQNLKTQKCNLWTMDNFSGQVVLSKSDVLNSIFNKKPEELENFIITFSDQKENSPNFLDLIITNKSNSTSTTANSKSNIKSTSKILQNSKKEPFTIIKLDIKNGFKIVETKTLDFEKNPEEYTKYSH
jgi:hypothetical protein